MAINKISGIDRRFVDMRLTVMGVANDLPSEMVGNTYAGLQYIVGDSATGAFAGMSQNDIAAFDGTEWKRIIPKAHQMEVYDKSANAIKRFSGSEWVDVALLASKSDFDGATDDIDALEKYVKGDSSAADGSDEKLGLEGQIERDYVANDDLDTKVANAGYIKTADLASQFTDVHEVHALTAAEVSALGFDLTQEVAAGMESQVFLSVGGVDQVPNVDFVVTTTDGTSSVDWTGKGLAEIGLVEGDVFFIMYKRKIAAA